MTPVDRISQSLLKAYAKLMQKKYRRQEKKFLVEGVHLVEDALSSNWKTEAVLVKAGGIAEHNRIIQQARARRIKLFEATIRQFQKLSDTESSQGIVAVVQQSESPLTTIWDLPGSRSLVVGLENVADPGNVGTIIRTCDWFGVDAVVLDENTVDVYNSKVVRATMGSIFHLPVLTDVIIADLITDAKKKGWTTYVTSSHGKSAFPPRSIAPRSLIVFGSEAHGVTDKVRQLCDETLTIPRRGKAESLNVAVSCGIVLSGLMDTS